MLINRNMLGWVVLVRRSITKPKFEVAPYLSPCDMIAKCATQFSHFLSYFFLKSLFQLATLINSLYFKWVLL